MLVVVETGGKQYHIKAGDVIRTDKIEGKLPGDEISFNHVLALYSMNEGKNIKIGEPFLNSVVVKATVLEQMKDKKIIVFKKKRRQNYRRKKGHRQHLTVLRITRIEDKEDGN